MQWFLKVLGAILSAFGLNIFNRAKVESKEQAEQKAKDEARARELQSAHEAGAIETATKKDAELEKQQVETITDPQKKPMSIDAWNKHLDESRRTE